MTEKTVSTKPAVNMKRTDSISGLEADLAFIEARLALLLHQPQTIYREAQQHTYETLKLQLQQRLENLKNRLEEHQKTPPATPEQKL